VTEPQASTLLALARSVHPAHALEDEPGYADLPEVRHRRQLQERAPGSEAWSALLAELRAWPARVLDHSTLHLDCGRQARMLVEPDHPGHHLVVWVSLLAPLALRYESHHTPGRRAVISQAEDSQSPASFARLDAILARHGLTIVPWALARQSVPEVGVGNLLPGTATLAACLFSSALT